MKSIIAILILALIIAGCTLPSINIIINGTTTPESSDANYTQAAQTVAAELTRVAINASPTSIIQTNTIIPTNTFIPTDTPTTLPSKTPLPTSTKTPVPCNLATWDPNTIDVTIPDNMKMAPNQVFSKTWRIRNVGACSWNSNYLLIFDHGDGMSVTPGYAQQLTTGVVNPGQWVDLTVNNLMAPASTGIFTGYWRLRDPYGVVFGITPSGGTFAVRIVVIATTTITLLPVIGESGSVQATGIVTMDDLSVGDSAANIGIEMFLTYDISSIRFNATILEVKHDMRNTNIIGTPFSLGILYLYQQHYGSLDASDYFPTLPGLGKLADWSTPAAFNIVEVSKDLKKVFQSKTGGSRIQFRLQFTRQSNGNGLADIVKYGSIPMTTLINPGGLNPALIVTYTTP